MEAAPMFEMLDNVIAGVARRSATHYQKQAGVHTVIYPFEDGRSQVVTVSHISSWSGRRQIIVYSIIGEFDAELDLSEILKYSLRVNHARLCMIQDKYLAISASLDPEECERSRLFSAIEHRVREVALMADNLEQEFFGVDVF